MDRIFQARNLLDPVTSPGPRVQSRNPPARQPEFLVRRNFFRTSWWTQLGTILSRYPSHLTLISNKFFRDIPVLPNRFAGRQIGVSIVLHAGAFLLLPFLLRYLPAQVTQAVSVSPNDQRIIYYHLANPEKAVEFAAMRVRVHGSVDQNGVLSINAIEAH